MSVQDLYEKTLDQYKSQLRSGRKVSLMEFCRERHMNGRLMNNWMLSRGIHVQTLRQELLPAEAARRPYDRPAKLFCEILPPSTSNASQLGILEDVRIEMPCGVNVIIGRCEPITLGTLLCHLKNSGEPCLH